MVNAADRELPYSGGRAVEGGTPFAGQLDKDGKPAQVFGALDGRRLARGVWSCSARAWRRSSLDTADGVRLSGVPNDPSQTTYWGKDSAIFMEELLTWLIG